MPVTKHRQSKTVNLQAGASGGAWQGCLLTWYDPALGGTNSSNGQANPHSATSSGEPYDATKLTCAAPAKYPFGTLLTFRYAQNEVTVRVNDRGGAIQGNHFDLSRAAANALGIINAGKVNGSFRIAGSGSSPGSSAANDPSNQPDNSSGFQIGSILDLLTAPVETIGGWLATIAFTAIKDGAEAIGDYIIVPAWHWNQRAAQKYQTDMFSDQSGKQLLWTAAFWGGGYWLLFTDPNSKSLAPAPVRNSRFAHHARFAQSLPARKSLVKPKDVARKTPAKPKPVTSRAVVTSTGTMRTSRQHRVTVTGTHARFATASTERVKSTGTVTPEAGTETRNESRVKPTVPNAKHRTRTRSLPDGGRSPQGGSSPRGRSRT